MDTEIRDRFTRLWQTYCPGTELPISFGTRNEGETGEKAQPTKVWKCIICDLAKVRTGKTLILDRTAISCAGGLYYCGYDAKRSENFRYFLSGGKPGVVEGERYKKTPEIVDEIDAHHTEVPAGGKEYVFKRWDMLTAEDDPEVVIFFARPEVLSALFTLANYDQSEPDGVICPFGSGCSSIIHYPRLELQREQPRAVLGMFDPSSRPCVQLDVLTMAFAMQKFVSMIGNMDESFLITKTWEKVKIKIARSAALHSA
jgi:uncharacterized protein (DUF169 family)